MVPLLPSTFRGELISSVPLPNSVSPEETVTVMGTLVDEIADFLKSNDLTRFPAAQWHSLVSEPIYVPEHLVQKRTFTSVLSLKYLLFD